MIDWVTDIVAAGGSLGVFALMLAENLFPPIPSEVIMPLAGFAAAAGRMSFTGILLAGIIGTLLGNGVWYEASRAYGSEAVKRVVDRHGRWFAIAREDVEEAEAMLRKHGAIALFFGRMLPGVRTLISVPAGLARVSRPVFYTATMAGSAVWVGALAVAGLLLRENYTLVEGALEPLGIAAMAGFVGLYLWHLWRTRRRNRRPTNS
ncbi:membrane protein DedA with SNARE-associated domain [Humitalea rosea]|uniref:Membrane protein DedA with SNARE-associated domain n=1 Tax=Humitalea rosea TaxID=990373 RepID=A0A2W7JF21_9PROT|nr:DedA family protein [Humitalea rosea]PZW50348.1 membrane protein DedA with SNARE-associated domain [Humitalea rosea]